MLETQPFATTIMGNRPCTMIIQVFKPMLMFNLHSIAWELKLGILEHYLTLIPGRGLMKEMIEMTRWNLRKEAEVRPPFDKCPTPVY